MNAMHRTVLLVIITCTLLSGSSSQKYNERPKIISDDGNLIISAGFDRNITLKTIGPKSYITIDNGNSARLLSATATPMANDREHLDVVDDDRVTEILSNINGPQGILQRLDILELRNKNNISSPILSFPQSNLQREVEEIKKLLKKDECVSSPCKNDGECQDLYDGYTCRCPSNWKGRNCDIDVNECTRFIGTDLGCQNGGTCVNKPGSYECHCIAGWYGQHCLRRALNCSGHDNEICGHGVCVTVGSGLGIKCFCDQGWTTDGVHPACVMDVNECNEKKYTCSINPPVQCVNLEGSYTCENCPIGYEGDGYTCRDIDECQTNNGGCSIVPNVQCMNTLGSRICGPCPPGYQGDGVSCTWRGSCNMNNGGCHPSARCLDDLRVSAQFVRCQCPEGTVGDGVGIAGCYVPSSNDTENLRISQCQPNPCGIFGTCHIMPRGFTCICQDGYRGSHCSDLKNVCADGPCKNGGVCREDNSTRSGYRCECGKQYTGAECQQRAKACRDFHNTPEGHIVFPVLNSTFYGHNTMCTWVIQTSPDKVLNVTFTRFHLEDSAECNYDWLEIHDGRSYRSHKIGKFCGNNAPKGGNIVSSHNSLYFWFRSDQSIAGNGFSLHWESIDPICGGSVNVSSHGQISSPGSPGPYPPNRDCYWYLTAKPGMRIQLHFFLVELEAHANCSLDYIEISNGLSSDTILQKYCNSTQPPPFTSPGPSLQIHFHSDARNSARGFQISYALMEGIPGCGGLYTAERGELTSPTIDEIYLNNLYCEYKIQVLVGNLIKITFLKFDLEKYNLDSLSVYDGGSTDSKLVSKYSGTRVPPSYTSSSNEMFFVFQTDEFVGGSGFKIKYEMFCYESFTEEQGVITSPGYPKTYPSDRTCKYLVQVPHGKALELRFNDFDLEDGFHNHCNHDIVRIYDGDSSKSPRVGKFCGDVSNTPPIILSTHNYIYLEFISDRTNVGTGFSINYTTIDTGCGGFFKDDRGIISFPNQTENDLENTNYDNDKRCSWILSAPIGFAIQLSWMTFDVEMTVSCRADSVNLFDIDSESGDKQLIGSYCGDHLPPALTSTSNILMVNFTSDESVSKSGFTLSYIYVNTKALCKAQFISSSGVLTSPGWPDSYPPQIDCEWTITLPLGQQIFLNFQEFNLEDKLIETCADWVEIRNGGYKRAPVIGKYCGSTIPKPITSLGNALYIHFQSDYTVQKKGFRIEWHETVTGCGGSLIGSEGSLMSPNYPQGYGKNSECYWTITTSAGSAIEINFTDLDLDGDTNCKNHYIEFYDGRDDTATKIGRYCSIKSIPKIISSSNHMFVKYRSVIDMERKGFSFDYRTVCNRNLSDFSGVIESLDFPNYYPSSLNCTWNITAPRGNTINVTFSHFFLERSYAIRSRYPQFSHSWHSFGLFRRIHYLSNDRHASSTTCSADSLLVRDGIITDNSVKLCGSNLPSMFTTKSNELQVNFVSDGYIQYSGFRLEWIVDGCGGVLRKPEGMFSPLFNDNIRNGETQCNWKIITAAGTSIELTISALQVKTSPNCTDEYIVVYNGLSQEAPAIWKMCHSQNEDSIVTSSSNYMYVVFNMKSYSKSSPSGFVANFKSTTSKCGGKFVGTNGVVTSPNYPNNYGDNLDCFWFVEVDKNHLIELSFLDFDIEGLGSCRDFVKIYDGVDPADAKTDVKRLCGSTNPFISNFISKTNKIVIQLGTNDKTSAKGFKLKYRVACGVRITTDTEGFINNNPAINDRINNNCTWTILGKRLNQRVSLTFTHIDILKSVNQSDDCMSDYIYVFDGDDVDAPLIGKYCSRRVPPTIVSQGSAVTIQLGSNFGEIYGQFSAHYSVLSTACGGVLSSESGSLTSPHHPDTYPFNSDCIWTFKTSPGNKVSMSFEKLDIESSENCNRDYIEIRESDGSGKILGVYCGNEIPIQMITATQVYIKFHSDDVGTAPGFILHYSFIHGNDISGITQGQIASPLYPKLFTFGGEYSWRVTSKLRTVINVAIQDFEVFNNGEYCSSYLSIYDGFDDNAPILFSDCGIEMPETVSSTSNIIFIKLHLESLNEGSKFLLEWREISTTDKVTANDGKNTICNSNNTIRITKGTSFHLTSPGYPVKYDNNLNCEWIFSTDEGNHLTIDFVDVDLKQTGGCYIDTIQVSERKKELEKWVSLSGNLCHLNETKDTNFHTNGLLRVKFITQQNEFTRKGFSAVIISECGGDFTSSSAVIQPFIQPVNISNVPRRTGGTTCIWTVRVRPGRTIRLDIHMSDDDPGMCESYVMLRDGGFIDSPNLGKHKYCNNTELNTSQLMTTGNRLHVKYVTPRSFVDSDHLRIRYTQTSVECGFRMTLTDEMNSTTISSPNFPNIPPSFSECIWIITAPAEEILQLDVIDRFDLTKDSACSKEMLEIRDGGTENSDLIGVFCGETPSTQKSNGNMLFVRFMTNIEQPKNGFKAKITIGTCGGTIRGEKGSLVAGYPAISHLPPGTSCEWHLIGLPATELSINFVDLHLPPSEQACDTSLQIFDILPSNRSLVTLSGPLCHDSRMPGPIRTMSNEVVVRFHKGTVDPRVPPSNDNSYRGFNMNFNITVSSCQYNTNEPSGFLQSPGYPNYLGSQITCEWKITAPADRRVTLEILDFDRNMLGGEWLFIYEDIDYGYPIKIFDRDLVLGQSPQIVKSSGNGMLVSYYRDHGTLKRGFKAKYSSNEPTVCLGSLSQSNGTIYTPTEDFFMFKWYRVASEDELTSNKTILLKFSNVTMTGKYSLPCIWSGHKNPIITIDNEILIETNDIHVQKELCGNYTRDDVEVRSPVIGLSLTVKRTTVNSSLYFKLDYTIQPCGGVIRIPEGDSWIALPVNHTGSLDCAWLVFLLDGHYVEITTEGDFDSICDAEYLKISEKYWNSDNVIRKYCKNETHTSPLRANYREMLIDYHSDSFSNNNNLIVKFHMEKKGCGGETSIDVRALESPNFPKSYNANQECVWDIQADFGFRVTLSFEQRFHVEETKNCTKDFVQVYDFANDKYVPKPKLCGRDLPESINSTSNKMKVVFRSDASVNSDGFRAVWTTHCGGSYQAIESLQWLHSPMFDWIYKDFGQCVYKITAKDKYIRINFSEFNLANTPDIDCTRIKVVLVDRYNDKVKYTYCGNTLPPAHKFKDGVDIYFTKEKWVHYFNFNFTFAIDSCHAEITKPGVVSSPRNQDGTLDRTSDCRWDITAPKSKIVVLKFTSFILSESVNCYIDYISVFDGPKNDAQHRLALLCGSLNNSLPVIRSSTNQMSIFFMKSYFVRPNSEGFDADIIFTYDERSGCGGNKDIQVNGTLPITSPRVRNHDLYDPFLDCQTIIKAVPGQVLSVTFQDMHISPCTNNSNRTTLNLNHCHCDFVELRDGGHSNAYLIGRYCGYSLPAPIVTSTNYLYVRFVSDGVYQSTGYRATVSAMYSRCGKQYFESSTDLIRIVPPRDENGAILRGLHCSYTINVNVLKMLEIRVKEMDMQPPSSTDSICRNDRLEIKSGSSNDHSTYGRQFILGGNIEDFQNKIAKFDTLFPGQLYTLCGKAKRFTFFTSVYKVSFKVITSAEPTSQHYTGFELEILTQNVCNRTYTEPQNHIYLDNFVTYRTCNFLISAPQNHTIALFFKRLSFSSSGRSYIEIKDGNFTNSTLLDHINLISRDSERKPFFSTGRYMLLQMHEYYERIPLTLDMYYTTTDKGRGCGGRLYKYDGFFTSPMYPAPYRSQSKCEWIVETPPGSRLQLKIPKFDLGSRQLCRKDYLEVVDRAGEILATYCSDDEPATLTSVDNYIKVAAAGCTCCVQHACNAPQPAWDISLQHRFWAPGRIGNLYSPNPGSARRVSPWSWFPWPRSSNQRLDAVPHVTHSGGGGGGSAIPPSSGDSAYGFCAEEGERGGGGQVGREGGAWGPPPPYSPAGRQGRHHIHSSPDPASTHLLHHTHAHMDMHHPHTHLPHAHPPHDSHLAHTHPPLDPNLIALANQSHACNTNRASSYNINQIIWEQQNHQNLNLTLHGHLVPFTECRLNESLGRQFDSSRYMGSSDGLEGMVVQPIVQDGDLLTVNTAILHRGGNECLHRMAKEQGNGREEYSDEGDVINETRRIPPMTRPRDVSNDGIGLEAIQGKENLAFQSDKHSPIRSSLAMECDQQQHHHQRTTSQPHHNAESEVYFADVSSCCNMSVKADCCGNSALVGTHSLVGTIENHPESTSDSETGSFTLTRQQRPQPQTGSKRRTRLPSNENRNQNSVLELTQQNTSLLEDCLNRSSPGGKIRMSPLNASLRRPNPIHRKSPHNNSSLTQSSFNSSLTQSNLNASLTQSQLNASSNQSDLNKSTINQRSVQQNMHNDTLNHRQMNRSINDSYNRNNSLNYEEPETLNTNRTYHRRGSSDELNIASTHEYYVPTQKHVQSPLTPNTEESNLSEDETDKTFNEQRNVNESMRRRNNCMDEGKTVTQMLNEQLHGGPLKSNHLRCYSDTNTMDSGWQSGSEKHVTD